MFNWIKNLIGVRNDYSDNTVYKTIKAAPQMTTPIPPIPNIPAIQQHDHYRIGYDSHINATTITIHSDGTSMTLSLPPIEVMRIIRMLGATLDDEILSQSGIISDDDDSDDDEDYDD